MSLKFTRLSPTKAKESGWKAGYIKQLRSSAGLSALLVVKIEPFFPHNVRPLQKIDPT